MKRYECYSEVKLITDKYISDGVPCGRCGIIIEVYNDDDYYEVQFYDESGELSSVFFAVAGSEIVLVVKIIN